MPKARLGVALLLPPPLATEVDGLRRALGDGALGRVAPHLTLVPPVNVRDDRLPDALAVLRAAAATVRPFTLALGPPATFHPDAPVVYLAVGGDPGAVEALRTLRDAVFTDPLARTLTWPWVPHVTLVDDAAPDAVPAAVSCLAGYRVEACFERVHLLREGPGRVWEPVADAAFAADAVVGRGGLPLALAVTDRLDPEAAALVAGAGRRPFAVTARRQQAVVGTASGSTGDDGEAVLDHLAVAAQERGTGVGSRLLAAVESLAAERGCTTLAAAFAGDAAGFLRHRGWAGADGGLRRHLG